MSALRGAGVDVAERHVELWEGRRLGPLAALRVAAAEVRLMVPRRRTFDVVVVGYPGHFDMPQARGIAGAKPLVFLPRVSLARELIDRRGRFERRSMTGRVLEATDLRALKLADAVVADTDAAADHLADLAGIDRGRVVTIFAGAEERVFSEGWAPVRPFAALHVAGPGTSLRTLLAAARLAPGLSFRVAGRAVAGAPDNVEFAVREYDDLGLAYAHAGVAVGALDEALEIPDAAFHALATGTPLVTADTPAARELLVDGETALLVPAGDAEATAAAVQRLADDRELAARVGRAGRLVYEERASEAVLGARWRAFLERQTGIV